jgi:hypothetical protein
MKFDPATCPLCGRPPTGILEEYAAVTRLLPPDAEGDIEFGDGTDLDWSSGTLAISSDDEVTLFCRPCCRSWEATLLPELHTAGGALGHASYELAMKHAREGRAG